MQKVATGFTGRRAIVEDKRCNACHQELGTFTEDAFHAGQRNDGTTCSWCHTPNRNSSGWTADSTQFVHGIHGAEERTVRYTWHAVRHRATIGDCETSRRSCIRASWRGASSATSPGRTTSRTLPRRMPRDSAGRNEQARVPVHLRVTPDAARTSRHAAVTSRLGAATTGRVQLQRYDTAPRPRASDTTLLLSPTVAACVGCHDSALAISHFQVNGGRFYEARTPSSAGRRSPSGTKTEQCLICHGSGRTGRHQGGARHK